MIPGASVVLRVSSDVPIYRYRPPATTSLVQTVAKEANEMVGSLFLVPTELSPRQLHTY